MSTRENGCPRAVRAFVYEVERRANTKILRGSIMARPVGLVLEMQVQPGPSDAGARMDERVGKPYVHEPGAQGYGWLMRADGSNAHTLTDTSAVLHGSLNWSPDGKYILYDLYLLDSFPLQSRLEMVNVKNNEVTNMEVFGSNPKWVWGE